MTVRAYPPDAGGRADEIPTAAGAVGGSTIATQDEGISVDTDATTLNFVGAGVTATDAGSGVTTVTIPGGGSSLEVLDEGVSKDSAVTSIDFVGAGVTATNVGHAITVTIPGGSALADGDYGDITVSGSGTVFNIDAGVVGPTELAATAVAAGSYGDSLTVGEFTVDADGRLTAAADVAIATMVGDSGSGGTKGLVPAPAAGDAAAYKFLSADGTWDYVFDGLAQQFGGNGQDGNLTINSGTTTMTRSMYYDTVTITGTGSLFVANYMLFCKHLDLSNAPAGAIICNGNSGTSATGSGGGAAATGNLGTGVMNAIAAAGSGGNGASGVGAQGGTASATTRGMGGASNAGGAGGVRLAPARPSPVPSRWELCRSLLRCGVLASRRPLVAAIPAPEGRAVAATTRGSAASVAAVAG
jgi:hypothetical protein